MRKVNRRRIGSQPKLYSPGLIKLPFSPVNQTSLLLLAVIIFWCVLTNQHHFVDKWHTRTTGTGGGGGGEQGKYKLLHITVI